MSGSNCNVYFSRVADVHSTGDKTDNPNDPNPSSPFMRFGYCDGSVGDRYKVCCSGTSKVNALPMTIYDPYNPPYEAQCPAGATTRWCGPGGGPACDTNACGVAPPPTPPPADLYEVRAYCAAIDRPKATIKWRGGDTTKSFWVDVSWGSDGFGDGYWNKPVSSSTYSTVAPDGFSGGPFTFENNRTYEARVWQATPPGHSNTYRFTSADCRPWTLNVLGWDLGAANWLNGVSINDINNFADGVTQYTITGSPPGIASLLIAPATSGGYEFVSWTGCDSASGQNCAVSATNPGQTKNVGANYRPQNNIDLLIDNPIVINGSLIEGQTLSFTATARNIGTTNTPSDSGGIGFGRDTGGAVGLNNQNLGVPGTTTIAGNGGTQTRTSENWPNITAGTHTIWACADYWQYVTEAVEINDRATASGNNCRSRTFTVASAPSSTLNIQSQPPTGVFISGDQAGTSNNTNYSVSTVTLGTDIGTTLSVPGTDPGGYTFQNWTGCDAWPDGATGRRCYAQVKAADAPQTVVANYAGVVSNAVLNVQSQPPTGISISGSQGGTSGTTNYTVTLASNINTNLTAPLTFGSYTFQNWAGCDSASNNVCTANVSTGQTQTVVANYTTTATCPLPTGSNRLEGCYYETPTGDPNIQFLNPSVSAPEGAYHGDYANNSPVEDTATAIDLNPPNPASPPGPDWYSGQWQGRFLFKAGTYTFFAGSDDGVRFYVDGAYRTGQWIDRGYAEDSVDVTFSSQGTRTLRLEYYQKGGGARVSLRWTYTPPPVVSCTLNRGTNRLQGCYYETRLNVFTDPSTAAPNGTSLSSPVPDTATAIDLNPPTPPSPPGPDVYNSRYEGTFTFKAGTYTFYMGSDDGGRLDLNADGSWEIDQWGALRGWTEDATPRTFSAQTSMPIRVDYNQEGGGVRWSLRWTYAAAGGPDLLIQNPIVINGALTPGQLVSFTATMENIGTVATGADSGGIGFGIDNSVGNPNQNLGVPGTTQIAAGGTQTRTSDNWTVGAAGSSHTIWACADYWNFVNPELVEVNNVARADGNNCRSMTFTVPLAGGVDLVVPTLYAEASPVYQYEGTRFRATAQNIGTVDSPSSAYLRFCVDASVSDCYNQNWIDLSSADRYLCQDYVSSSYLQAGETSPEETSYFWDAPVRGNHTIVACIDPVEESDVAETNEAASSNCRSITVNVAAIPGPDLEIASFTRSISAPDPGQSVTFTSTVFNRGGNGAGVSQLRYCIGLNGTFSQNDCYNSATNRHGSDLGVGALASGATSPAIISAAWTAQRGSWRVYVCADATHVVGEFDETNNCSSMLVSVGDPDFVIDSLGRYSSSGNPPGTLDGIAPGTSIRFGARVQNIGDIRDDYEYVRFCLDVTDLGCMANSGRIGSDRSSPDPLNSGEISPTLSATTNWTTTAGSHTLVACADPRTDVGELDENNNCRSLAFIIGTTRTLTVARAGSGSGTVQGPGIACGADCTEVYPDGTNVSLLATPAGGSVFASWAGCDSVVGSQCNVTMNADRTVTATFNTGCVAACTPGERRCVDSTHYQICEDVAGCPAWNLPPPGYQCAVNEFCRSSTGFCEELPDWHEIPPVGAVQQLFGLLR